jgi:hypothetical protein
MCKCFTRDVVIAPQGSNKSFLSTEHGKIIKLTAKHFEKLTILFHWRFFNESSLSFDISFKVFSNWHCVQRHLSESANYSYCVLTAEQDTEYPKNLQ